MNFQIKVYEILTVFSLLYLNIVCLKVTETQIKMTWEEKDAAALNVYKVCGLRLCLEFSSYGELKPCMWPQCLKRGKKMQRRNCAGFAWVEFLFGIWLESHFPWMSSQSSQYKVDPGRSYSVFDVLWTLSQQTLRLPLRRLFQLHTFLVNQKEHLYRYVKEEEENSLPWDLEWA